MSELRERTALVVNFSGGKDSSAMLAFLHEHYRDYPIYVVHADTGFEHVAPVSAREWSEMICRLFGLELNVCRNPNKTYLEMVERRGMFPSAGQRQCTSDLKRGPVQTWIRNHVKERKIINCMGMRADESPARSKLPRFRRNKALSKAGRLVYDWHPILNWTEQEVLSYLASKEIPLHPIYVWAGGYLRRFSCRVCIFMSDHDIRQVHEHDRAAFDLVADLERKTGFTMKNGKSLIQIVGANHDPDEGSTTTSEHVCGLWDARGPDEPTTG